MRSFKYCFMLVAYLWLRFDPILRLTFKNDWTSRYDFFSNIFGKEDATKFLEHRVDLVKARNKKMPPLILPNQVYKKAEEFIKINPETRTHQEKRLAIINQLIFWALDPEINQGNIDSYKTRYAIVEALTFTIFQNSLISEIDVILEGLRQIVFSRVTYLGAKGEPSPVVHDAIISGTGRILTSHINEIIRVRDEKLDKLTKVKLIKEIQKTKGATGSLAFSAEICQNDNYKNKYPLPDNQARLLWQILSHYRFSSWPESREKTQKLIDNLQKFLGFPLDELFAVK